MYIVKAKQEDIKNGRRRLGRFEKDLLEIIKNFEIFNFEIAEIKDYNCKSVYGFQRYAIQILKKNNIFNFKVIVSGGRVFIVKIKTTKQ